MSSSACRRKSQPRNVSAASFYECGAWKRLHHPCTKSCVCLYSRSTPTVESTQLGAATQCSQPIRSTRTTKVLCLFFVPQQPKLRAAGVVGLGQTPLCLAMRSFCTANNTLWMLDLRSLFSAVFSRFSGPKRNRGQPAGKNATEIESTRGRVCTLRLFFLVLNQRMVFSQPAAIMRRLEVFHRQLCVGDKVSCFIA